MELQDNKINIFQYKIFNFNKNCRLKPVLVSRNFTTVRVAILHHKATQVKVKSQTKLKYSYNLFLLV